MDEIPTETERVRPCTCHPDDRPAICQHLYATSECVAQYAVENHPIVASTQLRIILQDAGVAFPHSVVDDIEDLIDAKIALALRRLAQTS